MTIFLTLIHLIFRIVLWTHHTIEEDTETVYVPLPSSASCSYHARKAANSTNSIKNSPTARLDVSSLLKAERTLSSLQSRVREVQRQTKAPSSDTCLTPADRWFWPEKTKCCPRPEISLPRLQISPSSISNRRKDRLFDDGSNSENIPPPKDGTPQENDDLTGQGDGGLSEQFASSMRLGGRGWPMSTLNGFVSPPSSQLSRNSDIPQNFSCHHHRTPAEAEKSATIADCISLDANTSLRFMLEERNRLKEKMAYLKVGCSGHSV